jgi:hypothetical protein
MVLDHSPCWPIPKNKILPSEEHVTAHLKDTAHLESHGDLGSCCEEPKHLHHITTNPAGQDGNAEAFAGAGTRVGKNLGEGEGGLDGEPDVANQIRVRFVYSAHGAEDKFQRDKGYEEIEEEMPVSIWYLVSPLSSEWRGMRKRTACGTATARSYTAS